ncbi:MAG TPA: hypothetical protein VMC84_13350 [Methanocella sp.]|uniref:hypothetical protein n=1 Tax=Methanocella sp. TaxID=2052833 RepID=UPI002C4CFD21|nr:hypothetical protein [Methanocella sp.]HTY92155.1 hypothetical protein [Methanocella sp.]
MLILLIASTLTLGCVISPAAPTPTPTPAATATPMPTLVPTNTPTPVPSIVNASQVYMPEQTTNGRTYRNTTVTPLPNGTRPGGQTQGELGKQ